MLSYLFFKILIKLELYTLHHRKFHSNIYITHTQENLYTWKHWKEQFIT